MPDRIGTSGGIIPVHVLRGIPRLSYRNYTKLDITKPRRNANRDSALGPTAAEWRMANVQGSDLERIVYKRLAILVGTQNFEYKFQVGAASGVNARTFIGGVEFDFVVLNRPSGKNLIIEPSGAHWHGPKDWSANTDRFLLAMQAGYDFFEIAEYEIWLGDVYLDELLTRAIGIPPLDRVPKALQGVREIRDIDIAGRRQEKPRQT